MTRPLSVRYPFEPLALEIRTSTIETLAIRLGVSRRTVHRWALQGVPAEQADRAAIALGTHPACLWPEQWNAA
ncbi:hypothetical protein JYT71_01325 [Acidimicrobiaceae bacterium AH-315-P05]|nr:hypothetical protein [Acidimicrobiaceae bacterium AH-315-P05]